MGVNSNSSRGLQDREQRRQQKGPQDRPTHTMSCSHTAYQSTVQAYSAGSQMIDPPLFWCGGEAEKMDWDLVGSESLGSVQIAITNIGTPSVFADDVGSYEMVNNRSFSGGSNQTFGEGSQSPPSQASDGGIHGSDNAVGVSDRAEGYLNSMWQGQQLLLPDLYIPEPERVYDTCQQKTTNYNGYQDYMEHYRIYSSNAASRSESHYTLSKQSDESDAPWTHCDPRVTRFEPGDLAFGLSPEPASEKNPQDSSSGNSIGSKSPRPIKPKTSHKKSSRTTSKLKGKNNSASLGWEHIVFRRGGLIKVSEHADEESQSGFGRKGKLDREKAEKAARVRKLKACWRCWVLKVDCSEGEPCERCRKTFSKWSPYERSPLSDQLCSRSAFRDYDTAFFPEYLHSHFKRSNIEDLVSQHTNGFSDTALEIDVHTGSHFEPMRLLVNVFKPNGLQSELLIQYNLTADDEEPSSQLVCSYSAPVGLLAPSVSDMKKRCREHIAAMIENPMYPVQVTMGDSTPIRRQILDVIWQYHTSKANNDQSHLVRSAMMLHAIHYFMGHCITFTDDSAKNVAISVFPLLQHVPTDLFASSRLLSRQIKYAMHKIHQEITQDVLEGLERSMRTRTRDSWGHSFCCILILCLCIEDLQIAADTFVVGDMQKSAAEGITSDYTRNLSSQACQVLDDYPYRQCTKLFHDIYRSHKESNRGAREGGFNPLRTFGEVDVQNGIGDTRTEVMVRAIYCMIHSSEYELVELANKPTIARFGCPVELKEITANNTGRLVAKFLLSFFSTE